MTAKREQLAVVFRDIDFAIYCREWETENYDAFKRQLKI